jgi:hypothetical protein
MDWQMWVVIPLIGAAALYLGWSAWRSWSGAKSGCGGGCACANGKAGAADKAPPGSLIPSEQITLRRQEKRIP